jgi:serine/threonine-protein kinase
MLSSTRLTCPGSDDPARAPASRFQVLERIGRGATADVYRGIDTRTQRTVAIKRLRRDLALGDPSIAKRFLAEGALLARLRHPNIVELVASVAEGDQAALILEYAGGGSLRTRLHTDGAVLPREALDLLRELARALSTVHDSGLVHRDIKPDNVLLALDGSVRLADFGLARRRDPAARERGVLVGTVRYSSPEALRREALDERSDLWGLGALIFEALTGAPPFQGAGDAETIRAILGESTPELRGARSTLPRPLVKLIERLLAKRRSDRPRSARQVLREVEDLRAAPIA